MKEMIVKFSHLLVVSDQIETVITTVSSLVLGKGLLFVNTLISLRNKSTIHAELLKKPGPQHRRILSQSFL